MESLLNLTVAGGARVRILQITDTHLFAEKHETLLGVNTWESYQAVLDAIHGSTPRLRSDCRHGRSGAGSSPSAAYQHFAEGIASFSVPCVWLPGNHDFQPAMVELRLPHAGILRGQACVFAGDQWQILLLDSQVFGVPHGELSEFQLDWLGPNWLLNLNATRCCCFIIIRCRRAVAGSISTACATPRRWIACSRSSRG